MERINAMKKYSFQYQQYYYIAPFAKLFSWTASAMSSFIQAKWLGIHKARPPLGSCWPLLQFMFEFSHRFDINY